MKKLLLILGIFSISTGYAQLESGAMLAGVQVNLAAADMYNTGFMFSIGSGRKEFGISIAPTLSWTLARNWFLGSQSTFGIASVKISGGGGFPDQLNTYTDIGLGAFTRYYVDISKNQKWKLFGHAGIELNTARAKITYEGINAPVTRYSSTNSMGAFGGGIAHFGKKIALDLSMSTTALRFGIYRIFPGRKK